MRILDLGQPQKLDGQLACSRHTKRGLYDTLLRQFARQSIGQLVGFTDSFSQ